MRAHARCVLFVVTAVLTCSPMLRAESAADAPLSLSSSPLGAIVYLDGAFAGVTPLVVKTRPGDHRIRMTKPGYLEHSRLLTLKRLQPNAVTVRLTARPVQGVSAQGSAFKIVVIQGEDAVNVLQQRTAVAPVVEVRDKNDQPVAGALVTFTIRSGRATFNGARALSISTNAAGRAAATGLTPTGTGTLQIGASAAFNGQTAAITIAQTNVATAAQAAAAGSAGGASGGGAAGGSAGAGGAAAGTGAAAGGAVAGGAVAGGAAGGISATTIGVVGAAAAGGTLVATKAAGGSSNNTSVSTATGHWVGTLSGCGLVLDLTQSGGVVSGNADVQGGCGLSGSSGVTGTAGTGTLSFTMTLLRFLNGVPLAVSTVSASGTFTQTQLTMSGNADTQAWRDVNGDSIPQCAVECGPISSSVVNISANRNP